MRSNAVFIWYLCCTVESSISVSFLYWFENEIKWQDEAEADRSGLWVFEEMLWDTDRREQKIAEGTSRIKSSQDIPTFLHAATCHYAHYVPVVRARHQHHHHQHRCRHHFLHGRRCHHHLREPNPTYEAQVILIPTSATSLFPRPRSSDCFVKFLNAQLMYLLGYN